MNIFNKFSLEIKELVIKYKNDLSLSDLNNFKGLTVENPPSQFDFDLSCNVSLLLGKTNKVNPRELAEKIKRLRDHGAAISDLQRHLGPKPYLLADHPDAGYNQRMTDIQGALGSTQMDRAEDIVTERRRLAAVYNDAFADLGWLQTPLEPKGYRHGYQSYPCLFQPQKLAGGDIEGVNMSRNAWMNDLQKAGISTRPATHAVHMLTFYAEKYGLKPTDFPNAHAANNCSISLPLFHGMTVDEQGYVIEKVRELS